MAQAFLTYEQQINLLQNAKELSMYDPDFAKTILQKISYYSLIDGYKEPFKPLHSGKFYYGVTFEEIFSFYAFDEELCSLFLKYILKVEQHMKSMISYHFCEKYGEHQSGSIVSTLLYGPALTKPFPSIKKKAFQEQTLLINDSSLKSL